MPRPRGEVRQALADAAQRLYPLRDAVSSRELAEAAQVGYELARLTVKDMVRAGELVRVSSAHAPGERWHGLYVPAEARDGDMPLAWGGIEALADVMHAMAKPAD